MDRTEIAFFDVETSVPVRSGQKHELLEFGAILVCPRKLEELQSYSTLVRPPDLSCVSPTSVRCNGITREALSTAPSFHQVADRVYDMLHGRVWAGHNILRFDCPRIREAFANISRPAPQPKGIIDSLELLTRRFGRRAGNMKMATLASYFGLGQQKHRSLDDVRMNLEVVKYCATVLFLESSLPDVFMVDSPHADASSHYAAEASCSKDAGSCSVATLLPTTIQGLSSMSMKLLHQAPDPPQHDVSVDRDLFDLSSLIDEIKMGTTTQRGTTFVDESLQSDSSEMTLKEPATSNGSSSSCTVFLESHQVSLPSLSASLVPFIRGSQRIALLHNGVPLQICGVNLKVRFGVSSKFLDHAGRPRLSIVVEPSMALCQILDICDQLARQLSSDTGSDSEWRTVVIRKNGFSNLHPTIRLHIPTTAKGGDAAYSTEICRQEPTGTTKRLAKIDVSELESVFFPGVLIDAYFCLDVYDYQQSAGIRLVAKKLLLHSSMPVPSRCLSTHLP